MYNPRIMKNVFLETYGWPMVQVSYDDFKAAENNKQLGRIGLNLSWVRLC